MSVYSRLSDKDLINLNDGNFKEISDEGIKLLNDANQQESSLKAGISYMEQLPEDAELQNKSFIKNPVTRLRYGLSNDLEGIQEAIKKDYPQVEGVYKIPNENELAVKIGDEYKRVNPSGLDIGDLAGNVAPLLPEIIGGTAGAILGGASGSIIPGAGTAAGTIGGEVAGTGLGNAIKQGLAIASGTQRDYNLGETGISATLAGLLGGTGKALAPVAKKLEKTKEPIVNAIKNTTPKLTELLTSIPEKYSDLALKAELAGKSLFKGKFDKDTAYQPIEQKLRSAKNSLLTKEDFAQKFHDLGNKAVEGMKNIKDEAAYKIAEVLDTLNNKEVQNNGINNAIERVINSFGEGGVYNTAKRNATRVINLLDDVLSKEGLTLRDLHRLKGDLYDIGYQSAGLREGTQADVARGTAEQINNYLRSVAPDYKTPNERFSLITNVERGLDNENTIANKIKNIGSEGNILSGLDQNLKKIDDLLPAENKFYNQAKNIIKSEDEVNTLNSLIGKQYERNPRLLANRSDEAFELALEDLQKKTGANFMDDLEKIRAREAFEKWTSGQGGGSGSTQGMANFTRQELARTLKEAIRPFVGSTLGFGLGGVPGALAGFLAITPKVTGKGIIKGSANFIKGLDNLPKAYEKALELFGYTTPVISAINSQQNKLQRGADGSIDAQQIRNRR